MTALQPAIWNIVHQPWKHPGDTYYDIFKHLNFTSNSEIESSKVSFMHYLDTTKV